MLCRAAIFADGLTDREHVKFIEAEFERGAAMPGGAEGDALRGDRRDPAARCNRR